MPQIPPKIPHIQKKQLILNVCSKYTIAKKRKISYPLDISKKRGINMIKSFKKFINYVEENYHSSFTEDDIKNITGYSYQYFNKCFKEIWHMTPQVYRKRRQLTLIALEIKRNTVTIKESDLAPWTDDSAFLKAFKREFNITPYKYIKEKDFTLQEKIEIPPQVYMDYMLNNHNKSLEEKYESLFCK